MAELDIDVLEWVRAYLEETGHPLDAEQVQLAIAALEDRDRLRAAMERSAAYCARATVCGAVLRAALEGRDG